MFSYCKKFLWLLLLAGCYQPNSQISNSDRPESSSRPRLSSEKFLTDDAKILANLKIHLQLERKEMGGSGRCLFHSLREQISQNELNNLKARFVSDPSIIVDNYAAMSADEKANLLRKIAIFEEKKFLETDANKDKSFSSLSADDQAWALEMAKDWHQELSGASSDSTRQWFEQNHEILWQYAINNRAAYWAKTSCETNWAGSAEAVALARVFKRPLKMYGQDKVSSINGAKLDDNGVVLPYLKYDNGLTGKDLLVFQTGGGGHYQMLISF